jgi:hypothetical protein
MPISTFHASFYDFISNKIHFSSLDPCISHNYIAHQCLGLMNKVWSQKAKICYLEERKCTEISESLAYACSYWIIHFTYKDVGEPAKLNDFFQEHLLRWMDCLSVLGKLGTALQLLDKLKSWANISNAHVLEELY